jgi:O-acetyl-ADP-ribose deacetylase (regulator of RNase III)
MDGGIDLEYSNYFGLKPQEEVQKLIGLRPEGYLPVGAAVLVKTGNEKIPYMISAHTMVNPGPVDSSNAFFAMSAILQVAHRHKYIVKKVFCPGLATGVGQVPYESAAKEMARAYRKWKQKYING